MLKPYQKYTDIRNGEEFIIEKITDTKVYHYHKIGDKMFNACADIDFFEMLVAIGTYVLMPVGLIQFLPRK